MGVLSVWNGVELIETRVFEIAWTTGFDISVGMDGEVGKTVCDFEGLCGTVVPLGEGSVVCESVVWDPVFEGDVLDLSIVGAPGEVVGSSSQDDAIFGCDRPHLLVFPLKRYKLSWEVGLEDVSVEDGSDEVFVSEFVFGDEVSGAQFLCIDVEIGILRDGTVSHGDGGHGVFLAFVFPLGFERRRGDAAIFFKKGVEARRGGFAWLEESGQGEFFFDFVFPDGFHAHFHDDF